MSRKNPDKIKHIFLFSCTFCGAKFFDAGYLCALSAVVRKQT